MQLSAPWRLGLLFLVAGAACQGLAARRGAWAAVRERSVRLLLPLVFGMAVVVPPQAYYEVLTKAPGLLAGDDGYLHFWWAYLHGGRYCHAAGCIGVPTWNHLWFLPYLWLYAVVAIGLGALPLRPGPWPRMPAWAWLLLPALALALARVFVFPHHPSTHNLVADLYNHLQYSLLFAIGWCSRTAWGQGLWIAALRLRWLALVLALLGWAGVLVFSQAYASAEPPAGLLVVARLIRGSLAWWAILAACGWAQRVFTVSSPWLRSASAGVFCFYIVHQTLIVVFSQWLAPFRLHPAIEAPGLILLTAAGCWLVYRAARTSAAASLVLGIRHRPEARGRPALAT